MNGGLLKEQTQFSLFKISECDVVCSAMPPTEQNSRLKDYGGFLLYLIPCLVVVAFTNAFLFPRFEMLMAGYQPEEKIPSVLTNVVAIFRFFFDYFFIVVPVVVGALVLAEYKSKKWKEKRRPVLSIFRFVIVFYTMIAMMILATASLAMVPVAG